MIIVKAKLLDYNTGKHYDVSKFFDEDALESAYVIRTNRKFIEGIFADAKITKKIEYYDKELIGYELDFFLPAHAAHVKIENGKVFITSISENAISTLGKHKILAFLTDNMDIPFDAAHRMSNVFSFYEQTMNKSKVEIGKEIIKSVIK